MKKKLFALLMAFVMVLSLAACGGDDGGSSSTGDGGSQSGADSAGGSATGEGDPSQTDLKLGYDMDADVNVYGPYYDEWSDMTDEELYQMALEEAKQGGGAAVINVYATSSKMEKEVDLFQDAYPGLTLEVSDLDADEVLSKAKTENETQNITADVLQTKDVNGEVFHEYYDKGIIEPFYPRDICSHIAEENLKYSYPLYSSQAFWYYNTDMYPDGQPISSWWNIIEKNDDGSQKYALFTKEIGQETAYLSLFASFINNADEMEADYKNLYGEDLEYTYDASSFNFDVPEKNAGVEYLWRFTQADMTFIGDGDELVKAVDNSFKTGKPTLALASAGKIENREESGYAISWCINLTPYTALLNTESMMVVQGCDNPAGARLFIRFVTGGADGQSGGLAPFTKAGNWPLRDDFVNEKNPATLNELGARANDLVSIYNIYLDVQDMWLYWRSQK